jgi:hypothetical protein
VVTGVVEPVRSGVGVPGRRTITITGYAAQRPVSHSRPELRRPYVPRHQRDGFRPDRYAALAVALAVLLVFVAATSAHGATLHVAALTAHVRNAHAALHAAAGLH